MAIGRIFEKISFSRRDALSKLVVGELIENKGRFMDDIVDGIWSICEESFWGVPAHLGYQKGIGLPDVNDPVVDLFAAETSSLLAWVSYLMGDKLDKVNPLIKERIYVEIDRRIFKVIEADPKYRWMGYGRKNVDSTLSYKERSFWKGAPTIGIHGSARICFLPFCCWRKTKTGGQDLYTRYWMYWTIILILILPMVVVMKVLVIGERLLHPRLIVLTW